MPLVPMEQLVLPAWRAHRGLGAFNVIHIEHAEAFVAAAEAAGCGVVLQISENAAKYHGALRPIALATLAIAEASTAPVVVHLDHAENTDLIAEALQLGFQSVMYDGSKLPYDENVRVTRAMADQVHARGASIEAELGEVGGKDGVHAPGVRTDPGEALQFVTQTGVDALGVAVGSSHAMLSRDAVLDFGRIAQLRAALPVPLVLHGSSGVPDADIARAVRAGMTKINIATHFNHAMTDSIRAYLGANPTVVDPRRYLAVGRSAIEAEGARLLTLLELDGDEPAQAAPSE